MHTIHARGVNDALPEGLRLLRDRGQRSDSRAGPVIRADAGVVTTYERPLERVLFAPWRDANPFFHLVESAWMLAGRDDLRALIPYVKTFKNFSDDGVTVHGAYGARWRSWFERDQLYWAVRRLRRSSQDRRVVIQMWDPRSDTYQADADGKDVPCNLTAHLLVRGDGRLHLTVFCRSNDVIWGAYGANAVHFSYLLEYMAARVGLEPGTYTQISDDFHGYESTLPNLSQDPSASWGRYDAEYVSGHVRPYPLFQDWGTFNPTYENAHVDDVRTERILAEDLLVFFERGPAEAVTKSRWPWLRRVVCPVALAHQHYRSTRGADRYDGALEIASRCEASDWRRACLEWIERRRAAWERRGDAGVAGEAEHAD